MNSSITHGIKHRIVSDDEFYTPEILAERLIKLIPLDKDDVVLSAAYGTGNFYKHYPGAKEYTTDFFHWHKKVDWIIDNPPYSKLDRWLDHSADVCEKGFAYLIGLHNLTPRRIGILEERGFFIKKIHLCKVFKWFGISAFIVWEKSPGGLVEYDRTVWR